MLEYLILFGFVPKSEANHQSSKTDFKDFLYFLLNVRKLPGLKGILECGLMMSTLKGWD
jgi:hypothetical protein